MILKKFIERGQKIAMDRAIELANPIIPWFSGNGKLLDYGCGIGHLGYYIAQQSGQTMTSLDVREYPISHPSVKLEIFDGKTIPYPDNYFDTTFAAYTLHHTRRPENVLKEIIRVTKNRIIISEDLLKTKWHIPIEVFKDILSNYFFAHITMQYKTVNEWEAIFRKLGLSVENRIFQNSGTWLRFEHVSWSLKK